VDLGFANSTAVVVGGSPARVDEVFAERGERREAQAPQARSSNSPTNGGSDFG
jgi:hypothetical protein